jgi:hypothetical protein
LRLGFVAIIFLHSLFPGWDLTATAQNPIAQGQEALPFATARSEGKRLLKSPAFSIEKRFVRILEI